MVFAVSSMNAAPDFVHPLAKDFADFLRLLLACGDAAALEQAWMWEKSQFEAFLQKNPPHAGTAGAACSALHFEAAEKPIEWRIEFSIVQFSQKTFRLI